MSERDSNYHWPSYVIITGRSYVDLAEQVNRYMDEYDYVPVGGVAYTGTSAYMQSMVRRDKQ